MTMTELLGQELFSVFVFIPLCISEYVTRLYGLQLSTGFAKQRMSSEQVNLFCSLNG